ncbi:DUF2333 family protein [Pseudomonas sp. DTU_2021_1001937_2_SI_NGA_ILE_001]|uniref:DUF2333 family protein n=1 Tax=Pseudomonas sp. DTU_2021_1001937_2_SI_NGA_ILE_001 TaxID=3077589 RepID=UPI0025D7AC5C|nr:DUF2333 family protein [Pseudomonas sp. DTU_2021_1001937_2_SI_NGA_ILE_001]WNW13193.1 DUF2333 family protein [Pseudomonas sp. DTU_2021_1001937_2_SI_NGA_ILE_001]
MLDWKNRAGSAQERPADTATVKRRGYLGSIFFSRALGLLVLVYLLITLLIGWYWSKEPALFPVQQNAQAAAEREGKQMVIGYTTVETLKSVTATLLDKPGGYLSNDRMPPGVWLDNMPSWEYGVLVQVRDLSRALRKDFARSQSQSAEDGDLARAEPLFNFDSRSWLMPSSESQYREGINALSRYQARLSDPNQKTAYFYARADNLNNWLGDVGTRLGSLSQRLSASVGRVKLNANLKTESLALKPGEVPQVDEEIVETPWMQIDNVFYEARGQAWALSHLLRAIEVDFADVLAKKNATVSVRQIIRELEASQEAVWSPMILNGSGFGVLANHSLVMANYISRANAAVIDLRQLLSQG